MCVFYVMMTGWVKLLLLIFDMTEVLWFVTITYKFIFVEWSNLVTYNIITAPAARYLPKQNDFWSADVPSHHSTYVYDFKMKLMRKDWR